MYEQKTIIVEEDQPERNPVNKVLLGATILLLLLAIALAAFNPRTVTHAVTHTHTVYVQPSPTTLYDQHWDGRIAQTKNELHFILVTWHTEALHNLHWQAHLSSQLTWFDHQLTYQLHERATGAKP